MPSSTTLLVLGIEVSKGCGRSSLTEGGGFSDAGGSRSLIELLIPYDFVTTRGLFFIPVIVTSTELRLSEVGSSSSLE